MKNILLKLLVVLYFIIGFSLLFSMNAMAYIDPSVMTYAIQAVAGIVIAIGAAVGVYIRSVRKKINQKLGVDENRNKEVESDDIVFSKKEDKEKINQ